MQTTDAGALYAGADLHGNNVFLAVLDSAGNTVMRKRVKTDLDAVSKALAPYKDRLDVLGVESTYNWYWFVDGLRAQGYNVKLGNPAKMHQYEGIKVTHDLSDAQWLAEQLRLGIFPECYIYPKDVRSVRDTLRRRQLFVRQRIQNHLSLHGLIDRHGLNAPGKKDVAVWIKGGGESTGAEPWLQCQLEALLSAEQHADDLAQSMEKAVLGFVKPTEPFNRSQMIPGIGPCLGMMVVLESGDFRRFPSAGDYASYCRTVKSERISNNKKKGENNGKNGNKYLAWAYIEAATFAVRFYPRIQSWYERKKHKSGVIKAKKALACKLAKAMWHVMNGQEYNEKMLFG
jgi:transposase